MELALLVLALVFLFMLSCILAVGILWFLFNKYYVIKEQLKDHKALESKYKKLKDSYILLHRKFKCIGKELDKPDDTKEQEQEQKPVTPFDLVNGLMEGKYEIDDEFK